MGHAHSSISSHWMYSAICYAHVGNKVQYYVGNVMPFCIPNNNTPSFCSEHQQDYPESILAPTQLLNFASFDLDKVVGSNCYLLSTGGEEYAACGSASVFLQLYYIIML